MGGTHLLVLGRSSLSCFQNLLACLVIRLGHGLGLGRDTPRCLVSAPFLCGTGLVSRSQGWGQGEETSEKTSETLRRPEVRPGREPLLGREFSMAHQRTTLGVLESSWGGVELPLIPGPLGSSPLGFCFALPLVTFHF